MIAIIYFGSVLAGLELLRTMLETLAPYTAFALIVMFQSEIRRMLARIGERPWASFGSKFELREVADEVLLAVQQLMQQQTGALIIIERDIGLRTFIESGVPDFVAVEKTHAPDTSIAGVVAGGGAETSAAAGGNSLIGTMAAAGGLTARTGRAVRATSLSGLASISAPVRTPRSSMVADSSGSARVRSNKKAPHPMTATSPSTIVAVRDHERHVHAVREQHREAAHAHVVIGEDDGGIVRRAHSRFSRTACTR